MLIVELDSWSDYVNMTESLLQRESKELAYPKYYRGHSDATWQLGTTLERYTGVNLEVSSYCRIIEEIQPAIETFTNKKWDLPSHQDFVTSLANIGGFSNAPIHFHYMGYLRHFGFPSPLLDWTYSPFVAAYFAFKDTTSNAKSVAIYSHMESWETPKITNTDKLQIYPVYPHSRNNPRHHLQQSVYTICLKNVNGSIYFANHEDPNLIADDGGVYLTKYIIPVGERASALYSLDAYNINSYSLFGSEESLLETMFLRKYVSAQRRIRYQTNANENELWS